MAQAWRRTASLRLTHRISLGFLFVLAVMLAVGGVNYGGYTRIHQQIDGYTGAVTLVDATSDIDRAFFELRLRVREFVQSGDDAAAQRLNEAAQATLQKLDDAARVVDDSARRETLAAIRQDAEAYIANASKIVDLHRERTRLVKGTIVPNSAKLRVQYGIFMDLANMQDEHKFIASRAQEIATKLVGFQSDTAILVNEWDADLAKQAEFTAGAIQNIANGLKVMADGGPLASNVSELNDDTVAFITAAKTAIAANKALRDLLDGPMAERGRAIAAKADELRQQGFAARAAISDATVAFMTLSSRLSLGLCVGGLALGLVLAWLMARSLSRPIVAMTASMKSLASGDKTVDVPAVGRADEIGEMAAAVQVFKENALAMDRLQADQIEQQKRASEERRSARARLADEFEASVRGVVDAVSAAAAAMEGHATALSATAAHATKQAGAVASASETASSNVQTVAAAAEELSASIKEISGQVANSARIAGQAVDEADRTNSTIQGLSAAAQKIGEVVKLINDIASQTNLLALNATIEAARAGEAGKGFAVVASEVKNLATQTAKATEDIAQQITGIQGATDDSVKAIESVGRTIGQINQIATTVAAAVEEQGAATQEIARNVQQAAVGTNEVTTHIAGVTQAANDTGSAAGLVLNAANDLTRQSETLRSAVDRFLANIRAA